MKKVERLTKGEEQIMHFIWDLGRCIVSDIIKKMPDPKPPHSTISSIVRILERKGFVDHKAYGRTHEYFPIVSRDQYSQKSIRRLVSDYFDGSMNQLVSFLVKEEDLNTEDLKEIIDQMNKTKS